MFAQVFDTSVRLLYIGLGSEHSEYVAWEDVYLSASLRNDRESKRKHFRSYCCLFFRFLLDRACGFGRFLLCASPISSKGRFVPEVGVLAELVHGSCVGCGTSCKCVPGITILGSDNIAR